MNADRLTSRIVSAFILILLWTLPACAPTAPPTVFHPPGGSASPTMPPSGLEPAAATPIILSTDTITPAPIQITLAPPCTDGLAFLLDLTIPDGTVVLPNQSVDKQWLVENSGTCNWDSRYRLRWAGGETIGAPTEVALYPARAGARVTLRILFTAPSAAGTYQSQWQAVSPDGTLFGDPVYMQIIVAP
jgi:hypothetical protein